MKRFLVKFFAAFLCATTVSGACAAISRVIPGKGADTDVSNEKSDVVNSSNVGNVNRSTILRNVARKTNNTDNKTKTQQNNISRSVNNRKTTTTISDGVNVVGRSARTEAASINSTPAMRRAGITLRASTAEVGGRATIGNSDVQTGSNIDEQVRGIQSRASIFSSNKKQVTTESLVAAKELMEKTSDLNNTCQQQYNECMDQFCAVVDTNQKRCSCSSNLATYTRAQEAVEDANNELNDVAQQIRYVGLSADEIRAIMSATEAELQLSKTRDHTKNRSVLDDIADMIKDPTSSINLYTSSTDSLDLLDMDFDFTSDSSDLFNLDLFNVSNDVSTKRGAALYNEAKKRCRAVISRCEDAGGTENQISGNYDLLIAKDCASYEAGLEKLNEKLKNNVRSANLMLQKARLAVLQNKNEYDVRECIGALETCMLDDMVCGEDYVKCVDPTKVYIDENGDVVLGRNLANIVDLMSDYNNTKVNANFIKNAISDTKCTKSDGSCIVSYLMEKIGTGQSVKDGGLCRPVLERCQDYTYEKNGKTYTYIPYNEVVVSYIQRALVNIKAAQSKIIHNYASTCLADVGDCYNEQNTQIMSLATNANVDNVYRVMKGTCYNVALTCGYAVLAYDMETARAVNKAVTDYYQQNGIMVNNGSGLGPDEADWQMARQPNSEEKKEIDLLQKDVLINTISDMFYQSLLCPDNSEFQLKIKSEANSLEQDAYISDRCKCKEGAFVNLAGTACVTTCPDETYASGHTCVSSCPVYIYDGTCVETCPDETQPNLETGVCEE